MFQAWVGQHAKLRVDSYTMCFFAAWVGAHCLRKRMIFSP